MLVVSKKRRLLFDISAYILKIILITQLNITIKTIFLKIIITIPTVYVSPVIGIYE